jgi:hypothetical protein
VVRPDSTIRDCTRNPTGVDSSERVAWRESRIGIGSGGDDRREEAGGSTSRSNRIDNRSRDRRGSLVDRGLVVVVREVQEEVGRGHVVLGVAGRREVLVEGGNGQEVPSDENG